ncbi:MAG: hypothetical protein WA702_07650 [Bradyrhizobium sp.]|uniref:hypothetical protein n=1 Tax=Bradyrhizobium sp. TaxID=376 RepID=UPI003C7BC8AB
MPEVGIGYEAKTEPNPIGFEVSVSVSGMQVRAVISNVHPFVAVLKPTGNVAQLILSGAAWPIAQTLGVAVPPLATQIVHRLPAIPITTIQPLAQTVEGETITITPSHLVLSDSNGMLMISSDISVT